MTVVRHLATTATALVLLGVATGTAAAHDDTTAGAHDDTAEADEGSTTTLELPEHGEHAFEPITDRPPLELERIETEAGEAVSAWTLVLLPVAGAAGGGLLGQRRRSRP